ncbi:phosphopantetheine-binding protein [Nocardia sp. NPDC059691]|uniref:phosphopantetheine-binding protein n=1 Tax=Nocardia sp. NPDC059691 TaxID=3346908 RepID=UPI00369E617F
MLGNSNEPETTLERLFEEILRVSGVRERDNFFDLGGTSIEMVELLDRIRDEFGIDLMLVDLLQDPSPRGIAARFVRY